MKRYITIIALLALCVAGVQAQIVGATNSSSPEKTNKGMFARNGWSMGASATGSIGFGNVSFAAGAWGDVGYHFSPLFYVGGSLGLHCYEHNDHFTDSLGYYHDGGINKKFSLMLLIGPRVYFSSSKDSFFLDARFGFNVTDPLGDYGRYELGVGYTSKNRFEVTAGLENARWYATGGANEFIKSKGVYIRVGYRFR